MRNAFEAGGTRAKELAAPDGAVVAETAVVPRHAKIWRRHTVLGRAAGNVRVVMLDRNQPEAGRLRPLPGRVAAIAIGDHEVGLEGVGAEEVVNRRLEPASRRRRIEIAEMLTDHGLPAHTDRHGAPPMAADGQRPWQVVRHVDRQRRIASCAPEDRRAVRADADNRIVAGTRNGAVVRHDDVRDRAEPPPCLDVIRGDRLAGDASAGGNKRRSVAAHHEVMERRVRQQHTDEPAGIRYIRGQIGQLARPQQHDGGGRRRERRLFVLVRHAVLAGDRDRRHHHRERPGVAPFTAAKPGDHRCVPGVAEQMEAARPFHRDDRSAAQRANDPVDGQRERGTACGTGDGLIVMAAVRRRFVLCAAHVAHLEPPHRRQRPLVRRPLRNGEPGTAGGARRERIPVASIGRIQNLAQAIGARRQVVRDPGANVAAGPAGIDVSCDDRCQRSFARQAIDELSDPVHGSFDFDDEPLARILHVSVQGERAGEPEDKRSKPDALRGVIELDAVARGFHRPPRRPTA